MARPKKQRKPSCPITLSTDGRWHGYLYVGKKPNGKDDVRHRSGRDYDECARKILELEDEIAAKGRAPEVGRSMYLRDYLRHWYAEGTKPRKRRDGTMKARWKYSTARDYLLVIEQYIIPRAGGHRLDEFTLTTRHAKDLEKAVAEQVSDSAARKTHLVLRSALSDAEEHDLVGRNVMKAISAPEVVESEEQWLGVDEGHRILQAIEKRPRLRSRWLMALTLGERQGQCLALKWRRPELRGEPGDVDLETGEITIRKKLYRKTWQHGCGDPVACVRSRTDGRGRPYNVCKANPCGVKYLHGCGGACGHEQARYCPQRSTDGCWRHRTKDGRAKRCPAPCPPDCAGHASTCPQRRDGGLQEEDPKTRAGKRTIQMPKPLWEAFVARKAEQDRERELAANLWVETGFVHTTELGLPIDPRRDWDDWYALLGEAGVDPIKLHGARHFAVTILLLLGISGPPLMHILGWSTDQSKRYGHVVKEMLAEVAAKLEAHHWGEESAKPPTPPGPGGRPAKGSSTDLSTGNVVDLRSWRARKGA